MHLFNFQVFSAIQLEPKYIVLIVDSVFQVREKNLGLSFVKISSFIKTFLANLEII